MTGRFVISERVAAALAARRPVVALETTLVTHGLPHPEGLEAAAELERLATATPKAGAEAAKLSLSNLAAQLSCGAPGSTTVAATMFAAARVGIEVFATGGIGGVHRHAADSGDVSSDLTALSRYPVAVVCAGAKAVLDLKHTVEALETLGVPVLGFGTDEFPAFYRRSSGLPVDRRYDSTEALARAVRTHFDLGLGTGVVVANPIPVEHEMPLELYEHALAASLADAERHEVRGRGVTPYLLERMRDWTASESVFSNRALLVHNARTAAALAVELAGRVLDE